MTNNITRRNAVLAAAVGAAALAVPALAQTKDKQPDPSVEVLRALLKAHDTAFTNQDLKGVLATLSPECALMGTTPGELWIGHEEISTAYKHFFEDFDKGKQSFEHLWYDGNVGPAGAWLMTVSKVTLTKDSKSSDFGLNLSITCEKHDDEWLIRAMHFSNPTGSKRA